jgi:hypothetical protein
MFKVTKLGEVSRIVHIETDPRHYSLAAGEVATTSVRWNTLTTEAKGEYRLDIYSLPSAHFINPKLINDIPALASVHAFVNSGRGISILSFAPDRTMVNDTLYDPLHPVRSDASRRQVATVIVHNSSKQKIPTLVHWKVYPYQQVEEAALLFATSTSVIVPPGGSVPVDLPLPTQAASRYLGIVEIVEGGQYELLPISFSRPVSEPIAISIFGIKFANEDGASFGLQGGERYTAFACPVGISLVAPTAVSLEVQNEKGETVAASSTVYKVGEIPQPLLFDVVPSENISLARLILTTKAGTVVERSALSISCRSDRKGGCQSIPVVPVSGDLNLILSIIGLSGVVISAGLIIWKYTHKHTRHEKVSHK